MVDVPNPQEFEGNMLLYWQKRARSAEIGVEELEAQLERVRQWGEDNERLIEYVQDMGKPTFQQALENES